MRFSECNGFIDHLVAVSVPASFFLFVLSAIVIFSNREYGKEDSTLMKLANWHFILLRPLFKNTGVPSEDSLWIPTYRVSFLIFITGALGTSVLEVC